MYAKQRMTNTWNYQVFIFFPVTIFVSSFWRREAEKKDDHSKDHSQQEHKWNKTSFSSQAFLTKSSSASFAMPIHSSHVSF